MLGLACKLAQTLGGHLSLSGDQPGEILDSAMIYSCYSAPLTNTGLLLKVGEAGVSEGPAGGDVEASEALHGAELRHSQLGQSGV